MSEKNEQYIKMTETPVSKLIISLGVPTIISMLVTSIYNMADTYFVGTIGTSASGATGVVFGLMAILQAFGFMFGHGAGANISRKLGAKDVEKARTYASTSFYSAIAVGLIIMFLGFTFMEPMLRLMGSTDTILPYAKDYAKFILIAGPALTSSCVMNNILRYEGKAFFAMIGLTTGGILNIFLDAYMVTVLKLGIGGAGLATCISQYISWCILLIPYLRKKVTSSFSIRYITKDPEDLAAILAVGSPSFARQGLNAISTMLLNTCAGGYGDAAVAAISIVNRICNFLFCVATGIGQGFQPVSAFNYGAKKYSRVRDGFWFAFKLGGTIMLVLGILGYLSAPYAVQIFRDDPLVIEIGTRAMKYRSLALWLMAVTLYGNMLFQSIGKSRTALLLASLRSGLVLIPVLLILTKMFGITGLEVSQAVAEVISAAITWPIITKFLNHLPPDETD